MLKQVGAFIFSKHYKGRAAGFGFWVTGFRTSISLPTRIVSPG